MPSHIDVTPEELRTDQEGGRVFFLPGSPDRARRIAGRFDGLRVFPSKRGHDVHTGTIPGRAGPLDVGCVSTGMGCPSVGIIVTELVRLGVRRLLRVGSAGAMLPGIPVGDVAIATGAVRDEGASLAYAPPEFPAVASWAMTRSLIDAATDVGLAEHVHVGIVHSKDSLHGREFGLGPLGKENERAMRLFADLGCIASEMEASHLFVLAHGLAEHAGPAPAGEAPIEAGCVLAILGAVSGGSAPDARQLAEERAIEIALAAAPNLCA